MTTGVKDQLLDQRILILELTRSDTTYWTMYLTNPSNDQLVKDGGAQIF